MDFLNKSYKNLLQEHFQKNGLDIPIYQTDRINGPDHEPVWLSKLQFNDKVYTADGYSKREAEANVAKKAYSDYCPKPVQEVKIERKQKVDNMKDIDFGLYESILLVDGENCDLDKVNSNMLVLFFAAKNTTKNKIFEYQMNHKNCYVFLSQSVGKDAADHLLTFYAGKMSMMTNKKTYVLTKDHYGEFLEKFMDNCKFICSLNEIPL